MHQCTQAPAGAIILSDEIGESEGEGEGSDTPEQTKAGIESRCEVNTHFDQNLVFPHGLDDLADIRAGLLQQLKLLAKESHLRLRNYQVAAVTFGLHGLAVPTALATSRCPRPRAGWGRVCARGFCSSRERGRLASGRTLLFSSLRWASRRLHETGNERKRGGGRQHRLPPCLFRDMILPTGRLVEFSVKRACREQGKGRPEVLCALAVDAL